RTTPGTTAGCRMQESGSRRAASFPGSSMRTSTGMPNHFGMCSKTARQYYARPTKRRHACARDPKGYHGARTPTDSRPRYGEISGRRGGEWNFTWPLFKPRPSFGILAKPASDAPHSESDDLLAKAVG